jgi:hypothetical protein
VWWWWLSSPKVACYACLDCGFINHYFDEAQLDKLRKKLNRE